MSDVKAFRADAIDKVTGRARYGSDFYTGNMLYAKVLWAPAPHARILKIDTSEAEKAPGVFGIVTRKDITGPNRTGVFEIFDRPILVGEGEETQFVGDAIALIAADTEDQAARARDLIRVEYEELPAVHSFQQALRQGEEPCIERSIQKGSMEEGLAQAAVVVERDYFIPYGEHAYLEPEGGLATIDEHDVITVYAGTQDMIANHRAVCRALDYPFHKVRIHVPYVGGAFGGKHLLTVQPYLVLLAHVLKRSVRLTWTREESLAFSCKKQSTAGKIRLALDKDGHICAIQGHIDGASAPYLANSGDNCFGVINGMVGPYRIPNIDLTGNMYVTTGPEMGAFRSVGAQDGIMIMETLLTEAADKLGLSQLEVRRRNWVRDPKEFEHLVEPSFMRVGSDQWPIEILMNKALEEAGDLPAPVPGKRYGRGMATAKAAYATRNTDWHSGSAVQMDMFLDGTINLKIGFEELGQGITGIATKFASEAMGIPEANVSVMLSDNHETPPAGALGFSQATVCIGNSILMAAEKMKALLCEQAAACLKTGEKLTFRDYGFYNEAGELLLDWESFNKYCFAQVNYLSVQARDRGDEATRTEFAITPVVSVADVEIDEETGDVKVLQIVHCHDIGRVIQPESARGQILGSAVMCQGIYLMEDFEMKDGYPATPSLAEYLIPTAMDIPQKNKVIFYEENKAVDCPYGAKGLGEHGMYTTAASISNAIYDAIKVPMLHLPVTPEKILKALGKI
nr:xanthine dehydrogenase family protein molybdopterin-binding subunit [uncultured Oscillibacter sp.]